MSAYKDHQFSLFGHQKPTGKVPISAAKIAEAKQLQKAGDNKASAAKMHEIVEALEDYERRITYRKK
jgi:hypothetical protein